MQYAQTVETRPDCPACVCANLIYSYCPCRRVDEPTDRRGTATRHVTSSSVRHKLGVASVWDFGSICEHFDRYEISLSFELLFMSLSCLLTRALFSLSLSIYLSLGLSDSPRPTHILIISTNKINSSLIEYTLEISTAVNCQCQLNDSIFRFHLKPTI